MSEHFHEVTSVIDKELEERMSKLTLLLIIFGFYVTINYVIPFVRTKILGQSIVTVILKFLLLFPIINILIKKILAKKYQELYDGIDEMLYKNRKDVCEQVPLHPMKVQEVERRIDDAYNRQYKKYSTGKYSGTIYHGEQK
jgi:uncharacterized membrane protein (DUF485 family)